MPKHLFSCAHTHSRVHNIKCIYVVNYGNTNITTSVRTIPWTLGEPTIFSFYLFFITGGVRALATYNDLQRYITATSVCTTCFMQALYRISLYRIYPIILYRHELIGETTNSHPQIVYNRVRTIPWTLGLWPWWLYDAI